MKEINWPALVLACLLIGAGVRSAWRRAAFRLVFPGTGERAGQVAVVWFRAKVYELGGIHCWVWLPCWLSRRLWVVRSTGSGRMGRWLRRQAE